MDENQAKAEETQVKAEAKQVKARVRKTTGRAKAAVGRAIGDAKLQVDGRAEEANGVIEEAYGMVKGAMSGAAALNSYALMRDASERLHYAARQVGEVGEDLYGQGRNAANAVSRGVRTQPLAALLVAGAIGYTVALLAHRR